jgi:hypothetical protein
MVVVWPPADTPACNESPVTTCTLKLEQSGVQRGVFVRKVVLVHAKEDTDHFTIEIVRQLLKMFKHQVSDNKAVIAMPLVIRWRHALGLSYMMYPGTTPFRCTTTPGSRLG